MKLTQFWNSQSTDSEDGSDRGSPRDKGLRTNSNLLGRIRKPFKTPRPQPEESVDRTKADSKTKEEEESDPGTRDLLAPMRARGKSTDEEGSATAPAKKASSPIESVTEDSILRTVQKKENAKGAQSKSKSSPATSRRERSRTENTGRTTKSNSQRARPQSTSDERPKEGRVQQLKEQIQSSIKESQEDVSKRKTTLEAKSLIQEAGRDSVQAIVALYQTTAPTPAFSMTSVLSSNAGSEAESSEEEEEAPLERKTSVAKKKEDKVAMVAREILSSERVYVGILKLISVSFKEFLEKKKVEVRKEIIPAEKLKEILSNIPTILEFNQGLLHDFEGRIGNWEEHREIADVLVKKGPFLQIYAQYLNDFDTTSKVFEDSCKQYPQFGKAVKEFENLPECGNLKLSMHMLKPVQRLPQYRLLLNDYVKHQEESSPDFKSTHQALKIVSEATQKANSQLKLGEKFQKMLKLQSRIGDFELIQAGRELVREGEMNKISRDEVVPRYFVLLNDCFLYTHYAGGGTGESARLKVAHCIHLNQLTLQIPDAEQYPMEFSVISNARSFTAMANSVEERDEWVEAIHTAKVNYEENLKTFAGMRPKSEIGLGDIAPVWIPDDRVTACQLCHMSFGIRRRRHHCRGCGKVVCSADSNNEAPLKHLKGEKGRVCDECYKELLERYVNNPEMVKEMSRKETRNKTTGRENSARQVSNRRPQLRGVLIEANEAKDKHEVRGFLSWKGAKDKKKEMSWCVLMDRIIYFYKASEDVAAVKTLPVLGWKLSQKSKMDFVLEHPSLGKTVFSVSEERSFEKWFTALTSAVDPTTL